MSWTTPKTDWKVTRDVTGIINGDYFNVEDYNRIKNNMAYLCGMAKELIYNFDTSLVFGADKTEKDDYYASEFNLWETAIEKMAPIVNVSYGASTLFTDNGRFITYSELNRIESAQLDLKSRLESIYYGRRRFKFHLGKRETFRR